MLRACLFLMSLSAPAAAFASDAAPVVAAERAFAAMAQDQGISAAFKTFAAEDGILLVPEPTPARPHFEKLGDAPGSLRWWPVYAGIAQSGDLGFTTGPFVSDDGRNTGQGWFFTIWKRQLDGRWRWLLDHGTPTAAPSAIGSDAPFVSLAPGTAGGAGAAAELDAVEAKLNSALAGDARAALDAVLADDARVMRQGPQPFIGRAAFSAALLHGPQSIRTRPLGSGVSDAGDLGYSFGHADWEQGGRTLNGHYVRLWQRRNEGWKLIVDELVPRPEPRRGATPAATPAPPPATSEDHAGTGFAAPTRPSP
ncbi:nuclear transport factor 2 family protein [Allosphingosinicella deserti]|uniref:DUF4440 domain-containing protein n=1 Tax=Allosphingosinicella deserti TaxID=2116704 RepID=A0A2P7QRG4_9SPHN|nr:nuclear transport factor 2 family protein [Sphingomonas deserti]PSJ40520.1 hypothetical protein C7I55_09310 [Sphingomonas deserti]